jgi:leucyl/phenylalanyl-tRNA--protein transferase
VAFAHLVLQLDDWGYDFIDCQLPSNHLFKLGAEKIRRRDFMSRLEAALQRPNRLGRWCFDTDVVKR